VADATEPSYIRPRYGLDMGGTGQPRRIGPVLGARLGREFCDRSLTGMPVLTSMGQLKSPAVDALSLETIMLGQGTSDKHRPTNSPENKQKEKKNIQVASTYYALALHPMAALKLPESLSKYGNTFFFCEMLLRSQDTCLGIPPIQQLTCQLITNRRVME
jgi:hypothetical protein